MIDTALVAKALMPRISSPPQAIFRAHFMRPVAKISGLVSRRISSYMTGF